VSATPVTSHAAEQAATFLTKVLRSARTACLLNPLSTKHPLGSTSTVKVGRSALVGKVCLYRTSRLRQASQVTTSRDKWRGSAR